MTELYLAGFGRELGAARPLDLLSEPALDGHLDGLRRQGLRDVRVSDEPAWKLGVAAGRRSLDQLGALADIGALVYSSEAGTAGESDQTFLSHLEGGLGVHVPRLELVAGHRCANLGPALQRAAEVVQAGEADQVLVVVADCAGSRNRLLLESTAVLSDGAATCVVSNQPLGAGYRLDGVQVWTQRVPKGDRSPPDIARFLRAGVQGAVHRLLATLPAGTTFGKVVVANYGAVARRWLAKSAGLAPDDIVESDVADLGHCFSADPLITLGVECERTGFRPAESVLVLCSGPGSWSAVAVRSIAGPTV